MTATHAPISPMSASRRCRAIVRDLKAYEIALLEGKAITETSKRRSTTKPLCLVNGIAGAVFEAGKRDSPARRNRSRSARARRTEHGTRQGRTWPMTKSNFEKLAKQPMFARPPRPEDALGPSRASAQCGQPTDAPRAQHRAHRAIRHGGLAGIQTLAEDAGGSEETRAWRLCWTI